eukprot:scaffold12285_cov109-Skeletonema_dohrnii-CCMP3373.AAC.2
MDDDDMMNDNDESVALVQLSGGSIVDEPATITSPPPSNNASATSSASASASEDNSETIPNNDNAHLSDQMIVQGNQPSLPELIDFCQSESLTEQGLRDRLSHVENQCGDPTYDSLLGYIGANDCVTYAMVRYFLQRFPSSASSAVRGITPLHVVCQNKNSTADIIRCVIDGNPEALQTQDEAGMTPLVYLCCNEERDDNVAVEIVMLLLDTCPNLIKANPDSMLHQVEGIPGLCHALFSPRVGLAVLKLLLDPDKCPEVVRRLRIKGVASAVLKLLLDKCPEDVRRLRIKGWPILHKAASATIPRAAEICRLLVQVLPELVLEYHKDGQPLHIACFNGNLPVMKCILEMCPDAIHGVSGHGFFPIDYAIVALTKYPNAAVNATEYLLKVYPNVASQHSGCRRQSPSVASQRSKCFPLFLACMATKESNVVAGLKTIKSLYDAYPEAIVTDEESFRQAIDTSRFVDAAQDFLIKQVDYAAQASDLQLVITRDEDGMLPLHRALLTLAPLGSIKLLAQADPATLQIPDSNGSLPLHIACKHCDPTIVKYLVDLDMRSLLVADHNGDTPLHCACLAANYDVIEMLLAQYPAAPVGERNVNGELPIQILLEHDEPENAGYMSSMFLLLRANPEMWMNDMNLVLALTS